MKFISEKGWEFDSDALGAPSLTEYARNKGLRNISIFVATNPDNEHKEYVIFEENDILETSQSFEHICCWIDFKALAGAK